MPWAKWRAWIPAVVAVVGFIGVITGTWSDLYSMLSARPIVTILSVDTMPFYFEEDGEAVLVCRSEVRVANTGPVQTSVVGVEPLGDFGPGGYLPQYRVAEVRGSVVGFGILPIFGRWLPVPLLDAEVTISEGPFRYQLVVSPMADLRAASDVQDRVQTVLGRLESSSAVRTPSDLRRALSSVPLLQAVLGPPVPIGLPLALPEHSVQDVVIDFVVNLGRGGNPFDRRVQEWRRRREDADPYVSIRLDFPASPAVHVGPIDCSGTVEVSDEASLDQFFRDPRPLADLWRSNRALP